MELKAFTDCTLTYLEKTFGLIPTLNSPVMNEWLSTTAEVREQEKSELLGFQELLELNVQHWNEQELSLNFIGPIFAMVHFSTFRFNLFAQRPLRATIGEIELYGKPDAFIASGFREPEIPFFAFHEYKREIEPSGHPAAQVLAAMVAGQALNPNPTLPIYGCYVIGASWYFMTLTEKTYRISPDYSARTNDLFDIFRILKVLKTIVIERVAQNV